MDEREYKGMAERLDSLDSFGDTNDVLCETAGLPSPQTPGDSHISTNPSAVDL